MSLWFNKKLLRSLKGPEAKPIHRHFAAYCGDPAGGRYFGFVCFNPNIIFAFLFVCENYTPPFCRVLWRSGGRYLGFVCFYPDIIFGSLFVFENYIPTLTHDCSRPFLETCLDYDFNASFVISIFI